MDINEILSSAQRPEADVELSLRGDLQSQWEELDVRLRTAQAVSATLAPSPEAIELAREIQALEGELADSRLTVKLRAVTRKEWLALLSRHAPRQNVPADQILGINADTFFDDLLSVSIVTPELSEEQLETLLDAVTSNQYDKLTDTAWALNRKDKDAAVFSRAASQVIPVSDGTSKRQSDSESARPASRAKSPRKSPSTSTPKTDG